MRRSIKLPFFDAFNSPDTISSCAGRESTVVASQALALLNSAEALTHARALAGRLWKESQGDVEQAARHAWILLFSREPSEREIAQAESFLKQRTTSWQKTPPGAEALPTGLPEPSPMPAATGAAWVEWCLALLNTNEFAYVD